MTIWTKRRIAKGLLALSFLYIGVFVIVCIKMFNTEKENVHRTNVSSTNKTVHFNSSMSGKGFQTRNETKDLLKNLSTDNSSSQDNKALKGVLPQTIAWQKATHYPANSEVKGSFTFQAEEPMPTFPHFLKQSARECVAPLEIKSSGANSHVIRLVDSATGEVVLDYFLPAGLTREILVPRGTYELRFASGNKWYGTKNLFGKKTQYSKATSTFFFSTGQGYSITLYTVPYGNLQTEKIREGEF